MTPAETLREERAREDRAHLVALAAGRASVSAPRDCAEFARLTFEHLFERDPEIGTPPADDAATKVARVTVGEYNHRTGETPLLLDGIEVGTVAASVAGMVRAALAGKVTP